MSNNCFVVFFNVFIKLLLLNDIGIFLFLYLKLLFYVNEYYICYNVGESGCLENLGSVV